jgi:hypothetical protein
MPPKGLKVSGFQIDVIGPFGMLGGFKAFDATAALSKSGAEVVRPRLILILPAYCDRCWRRTTVNRSIMWRQSATVWQARGGARPRSRFRVPHT